jgi:hypothetical protein
VLLQAPVSPSLGLLGDGLDPIPGWIGPYMGIDGGGVGLSGLWVKGLYMYRLDTFKGYIYFSILRTRPEGFMAS